MKRLADENFDNDILRGIFRRAADFDVVRAQDDPRSAGTTKGNRRHPAPRRGLGRNRLDSGRSLPPGLVHGFANTAANLRGPEVGTGFSLYSRAELDSALANTLANL